MKLNILENADRMGYEAALESAELLRKIIGEQGRARIVLSTGASQFEFLRHFIKQDIEWNKVEMFHLDEYIALSEQHPASFRKYLKERFLQHVGVENYWLINGEGDVQATIGQLNEEIGKAPIDLALIGIGENAHIAFNDPPANFEVGDPYIVVDLNDACKNQQVGEGWFASPEDVPQQAITMTVKQILRSRHIISCVPHKAKAKAIGLAINNDVDRNVPATILKTHASWTLYLDRESSQEIYVWPETAQ
ncbi:glucosamine-6-phosphate deaminase [Cohnella herbarum]|uniref:Glucosamine-6-phosphate deaminase n=1 Tax=Cohnella herbarum TaxID=2728023 RepID=A0A7Z2ZR67_9BACL|nr:glucosamine-6-phosphate deaminase [Cohnella herbarum]QJD87727.1 glucosamine-6-phosphate deaminase [Cohnella herbarum]